MFNETSYFADKPIQGGGPCAPGETAVDVGADTNICMSQADRDAWLASLVGEQSQPNKPAPTTLGDISTYIPWIAAAILGLFIVNSMGRR